MKLRSRLLKANPLRILAVILLTVIFVSTGCQSAFTEKQTNQNNQDQSLKKIVIGHSLTTTQIVVAKEKELFEKEFEKDGISVEYAEFATGPLVIEAFSASSIDFGISAAQPAVLAKANNSDLKFIGTYKTTEEGNALITRDASGIKSLQDLKGKKIGYSAGTTLHNLILRILDEADLKETDVELINLPVSDQLTALKSGNIDGVMIWEPYITQILSEGGFTILRDGTGLLTEVCGFLVKASFIEQHSDIAVRYLKVIDQAERWIQENPEEAIQIISKTSGQTPEEVKALFDKSDTSIYITDTKIKGINETAEYLYDNKFTDRLIDANEIVDLTIQQKAELIGTNR